MSAIIRTLAGEQDARWATAQHVTCTFTWLAGVQVPTALLFRVLKRGPRGEPSVSASQTTTPSYELKCFMDYRGINLGF